MIRHECLRKKASAFLLCFSEIISCHHITLNIAINIADAYLFSIGHLNIGSVLNYQCAHAGPLCKVIRFLSHALIWRQYTAISELTGLCTWGFEVEYLSHVLDWSMSLAETKMLTKYFLTAFPWWFIVVQKKTSVGVALCSNNS